MPKKTTIKDIKIVGDNILVEQILEDEITDGLIKSVQYEDKAYCGKIVALGKEAPPYLVPGMVVYFNKYSSISFPFQGKDYLTIKVADIVGYQNG